MRGRTNTHLYSGVALNGVIENYEVAAGENIVAGDFVSILPNYIIMKVLELDKVDLRKVISKYIDDDKVFFYYHCVIQRGVEVNKVGVYSISMSEVIYTFDLQNDVDKVEVINNYVFILDALDNIYVFDFSNGFDMDSVIRKNISFTGMITTGKKESFCLLENKMAVVVSESTLTNVSFCFYVFDINYETFGVKQVFKNRFVNETYEDSSGYYSFTTEANCTLCGNYAVFYVYFQSRSLQSSKPIRLFEGTYYSSLIGEEHSIKKIKIVKKDVVPYGSNYFLYNDSKSLYLYDFILQEIVKSGTSENDIDSFLLNEENGICIDYENEVQQIFPFIITEDAIVFGGASSINPKKKDISDLENESLMNYGNNFSFLYQQIGSYLVLMCNVIVDGLSVNVENQNNLVKKSNNYLVNGVANQDGKSGEVIEVYVPYKSN